MTSLGTLSRLTALTLLVTVAACADGTAQGNRQTQAAAAPTEPGPDASSTTAPPTLDIQSTTGISSLFSGGPAGFPDGSYYTIEVNGTGFPPGKGWVAAIVATLPDGIVIQPGAGAGANPADGSFRMINSGNCPSRFHDVYAYVSSGGRRTESKHIVPPC